MSAVALALMGAYLLVTLGIGVYGYRRTGTSPHEYFLAGGSLGRLVFPLTMFATLMSAFVFLGSAGFGYRHGLGWLALLGVEALAVVPLAVVGLRAFRLSRREGYVTPTEMLGDLLGSDAVKLLVVAVQFAWAIPYVAIQAMGGGSSSGRSPAAASPLLPARRSLPSSPPSTSAWAVSGVSPGRTPSRA
ncbi:hypothetical protein ACFQL1_19350 [Halomicroarcula sp. GCM10025709]|uniref:sodium:solute symporter family transporter n=1 Tax=Halomicroarcula sp. GCM10025709 TaxID=3252669 RepID=UPI003610C091